VNASSALLGSWGITSRPPDLVLLSDLLRRFSRLPYENFSKVADPRIVSRETLIRSHLEEGTGGTCFSLVDLFSDILRTAGFESRFLLADRSYGADTHCALAVRMEGREYLADPGFLIFQPVLLDEAVRVDTGFTSLELTRRNGGFDLHSLHQNGFRKFRYHLKDDPVPEERFAAAWKRSFDFEMMNYPVLTCVRAGRQIYLRDRNYHESTRDGSVRRTIDDTELRAIARKAGLHPAVTHRALAAFGRI
jgi:arylamine N-acetyltransferase